MAGGRSPARRRQRLPLHAFSFREIDARVGRERRGRDAVRLHPELGVVSAGPLLHRFDEALVEEIGERLAPVVADRPGVRARVRGQRGKVWFQVVAAARAELLEKIGGPVRLVHLEAVAEDREGRMGAERLQQPVADVLQIAVERVAVVVVQHEPLGADRRPLDHHAGAARDEEQNLAGSMAVREADAPVADAAEIDVLQKGGDELLAGADAGRRHSLRERRHGHACDSKLAGRLVGAYLRAAVRPPAADRQVHPQAELACLVGGEAKGADEVVRQVRKVAQPFAWIVEHDRIDRLDFDAADAARFHQPQLSLELRLGDRRAEPPPAHHDAAVDWRRDERSPEITQRVWRTLRRGQRRRRQKSKGRGSPCAASCSVG